MYELDNSDISAALVTAGAPTWDPKLVFELALGIEPLAAILERHGLTERHYNQLVDHPAFRKDLSAQRLEMQEHGVTFKHKARLQAEMYLKEMHTIITDSTGDVPASTKVDAIKYITKVAELEPDKKTASDDGGKQTINIQINV